MRFLKPIALVVLIGGLAIGMIIVIRQATVKPRPWPFTDAIRKADAMVVYEGLPHQGYEKKLLEEERRTKPVYEIGGFPFYKEPLEISSTDVAKLKQILTNPDTYEPFIGEKKCGGFHPDFAAEWLVGEDKYYVLICFGCGENKILGPGIDERFETAPNTNIEELLAPCAVNRPPSADGLKGIIYSRELTPANSR